MTSIHRGDEVMYVTESHAFMWSDAQLICEAYRFQFTYFICRNWEYEFFRVAAKLTRR